MTLVRLELRRPKLDICKSHNVNQIVGTQTAFYGLVLGKDKRFHHGMSPQKQAELEEKLYMQKGELNPAYAKPNQDPTFWDSYSFKVPDTGRMVLDLSDPRQELDFYRLKASKSLVAGSLDELGHKPDAILVLIEEGSEAKAALKNTKHRKQAFAKTADFSSEERQTLIMVYGERTRTMLDPRSMGADALEAKVDELVDADAETVLQLLNHPDYKQYGKVAELYVNGVIEKRNDAYYNEEGGLLGTDLDDMVVFLKDKTRSQEVANLYKRLKK